jgi:hypothetical protein
LSNAWADIASLRKWFATPRWKGFAERISNSSHSCCGKGVSIRHWTGMRRHWLAEQCFEHAAQQIVFEELLQAIEQALTEIDAFAGRDVSEVIVNWAREGAVAEWRACADTKKRADTK